MKTGSLTNMFAAVVFGSMTMGACVMGDNEPDPTTTADLANATGFGGLRDSRPGEVIPLYRVVISRPILRNGAETIQRPPLQQFEPINGAPSCTDAHSQQQCDTADIDLSQLGLPEEVAHIQTQREVLTAGTPAAAYYYAGTFRLRGDVLVFVATGLALPKL
jgi:hypothetical protein